jgi:hypothetical protein
MIPLSVGVVVALLVALTVYGIRKGAQEFEKERNELFREFADKHGLQYSNVDTFNLQNKIASMAGFGIAKNPLKNIVFIPTDQGDMYLFNQMKITGKSGSSQRSVFTVCLIVSKRKYGVDYIINEAVSALNASITRDMGSIVPGTGIIELGDKVFDDRFIVNGQYPESIKELLDEDMKKFLFDAANRFSVQLSLQIKGNMLAVYNSASSKRNVYKVTDLEALVDIAKGFPVSK